MTSPAAATQALDVYATVLHVVPIILKNPTDYISGLVALADMP